MLELRAREIVPHLAGVGGHSGHIVESEAEVVAVDWHLNGANLHLRANLCDDVNAMPPAPGRVIWGEHRERDAFAPWQVRVTKAAP